MIRLLAALLLASISLASHGQAPGLGARVLAPAEPAAAQGEPAQDQDAAAKVRTLLKAARSELARVSANPAVALNAPAGTPPDELLRRQAPLLLIVRSYEQQLDDLAALQRLVTERGSRYMRLEAWRIDDTQPAFSMLTVEALRARVQWNLRRIETLKLDLAALDSKQDFVFGAGKRFDASARQLLEQMEKRSGDLEKLVWERNLHLHQSQLAMVTIDAFKVRRKLREEELSQANAELAFLQKELKKTESKVAFSEADRIALMSNLDARLKALETELEKALTVSGEAGASLALAEAGLNREKTRFRGAAGSAQRPPRQDQMERELELARMRLDTVRAHADTVRQLISSLEMQRSAWITRYDIVHARDGNTEARLVAEIRNFRDTVAKQHAAAAASYELHLQQILELERSVISGPDVAESDFLKLKADFLRERTEQQSRLLGELLTSRDLLDRWNTRFIGDAGRASDDLGLDEWKRRLVSLAEGIWTFELFTAEDTMEIDGRKISATRSITLGKIVVAVLILVIGLLLGRLLIDASCRFSVRYLKTAENATVLAGKWSFALLSVILFLLSLTTVKIPFTVFAFLGGAVAIGIGFGMQTLFKNLISGLMILIERPFRLGDMVEVGNIRGKVVDINLRSSLIRNRDEIETLVPNSTFIEKEVTNWTYSSQRVRYTLNVGVAYGSPTKEVRDLLLATAKRHKLILEDPAPEVFLEDFGADSLAFSLQYWLDLSGGLDLRRVASDMRFMLDKAFTDAGIVMAFPQRDVHLDVGQAIPVRIVPLEKPV